MTYINITTCIADFMSAVKSNSSKWINEQHFLKGKFHWQEGYGSFSYAKSQRDIVIKYIMNQEEHHRKRTYAEEYEMFVKRYGLEWRSEQNH